MAPWEKSSEIAKVQINRRGMRDTLTATHICREAERITPIPFTAVSFRNGVLKVRLERKRFLELKLVQGSLIESLNEYVSTSNLPSVRRLLIDIEG